MNILLWMIQVVLAVFAFAGGAYKVFSFQELAKMPATGALPRGGWAALGVFEMVCAILLIVPAATKWMPRLTPLAALALTVESGARPTLRCSRGIRCNSCQRIRWSGSSRWV